MDICWTEGIPTLLSYLHSNLPSKMPSPTFLPVTNVASNKRPCQPQPILTLYLHLKYNPADPSSKQIQKLWRDLVTRPTNKPHLYHLRNDLDEKIRVSRLVIAYSRHLNIGNLLSYRKNCNRPGLKVSSLMD